MKTAYLMDMEGRCIHSFSSDKCPDLMDAGVIALRTTDATTNTMATRYFRYAQGNNLHFASFEEVSCLTITI